MSLEITLTVPLTRKGWIGERGMNVILLIFKLFSMDIQSNYGINEI